MTRALSMVRSTIGRKGPSRPRVVAIVPAAGYGRRLGSKRKKPFVLLGGKPLVAYALRTLNNSAGVDAIIIASEKSCVRNFEDLVNRCSFRKVRDIVIGGRTRFKSVANCLKKAGREFDIVLVHDGARPFIDESMIEGSIRLAKRFGGCVVAVPEIDTIKLADRRLFIKRTLPRRRIFRAQTPQVFSRALLERAYALKGKSRVTDDASLAEALGKKVKILVGSYRNIKITTKEDLKVAQWILKNSY